jgi:hypothetical protein
MNEIQSYSPEPKSPVPQEIPSIDTALGRVNLDSIDFLISQINPDTLDTIISRKL